MKPIYCKECVHFIESDRKVSWGYGNEFRFCKIVQAFVLSTFAPRENCLAEIDVSKYQVQDGPGNLGFLKKILNYKY